MAKIRGWLVELCVIVWIQSNKYYDSYLRKIDLRVAQMHSSSLFVLFQIFQDPGQAQPSESLKETLETHYSILDISFKLRLNYEMIYLARYFNWELKKLKIRANPFFLGGICSHFTNLSIFDISLLICICIFIFQLFDNAHLMFFLTCLSISSYRVGIYTKPSL